MIDFLSGLFAGSLGLAVWEGLLKPAQQKRTIARALAEEMALINAVCVGTLRTLIQTPSSIPARPFSVPTPVFTALVARIGELDEIADIVEVYTLLDSHVRTGVSMDLFANAFAGAAGTPEFEAMWRPQQERFLVTVQEVIDKTNVLVPILRRAGRSSDRWLQEDKVRPVLSVAEVMSQATYD